MTPFYRHLFDPHWMTSAGTWIFIAWVVWAVSWFVAAMWSRQTAARAGFAEEAPYRLITAAGALLLFAVQFRLWPHGWDANGDGMWVLLALVVTGFAFAWWARIHLGSLWSGTITRKEGHRIVDSGPYAMVRHPIYTGLLLAAFATAAARGRWEAVIGAALFALGCWMKARQEEKFLSATLGPDYAAYRQRVHMLVPYLF
ncbi:MAG: isoprenylcysteine carboxylmethyltransferase family protein [Terricaulis sp.]